LEQRKKMSGTEKIKKRKRNSSLPKERTEERRPGHESVAKKLTPSKFVMGNRNKKEPSKKEEKAD